MDAETLATPPQESLSLKWGTLKGWKIVNEDTLAILQSYFDKGVCASAMGQRDTPEQKELLCQVIDAIDAPTIYLDWDDEWVSKDAAKRYIMEYK